MSKSKPIWLTIGAIVMPLLVGCASSPDARHYILSAGATGQVANWGETGPKVLVGSINVPEYIKRAEIVFQDSGNQITLNEFDRWAESIDSNISDVLSENLARLLSSSSVYTDDSDFLTRPDVTIRVDVNKFGLVENQQVVLQVSWEIDDSRNQSSQFWSDSFYASPQSESVSDVVSAMSETLEQLSQKLSEQLAGVQAGNLSN